MSERATKRKRADSEDGEFDFGSADEKDLIDLADSVERSHKSQSNKPTPSTPKTPSRVPRHSLLVASEARQAVSETTKQAKWPSSAEDTPTRPVPSTQPAPAKKVDFPAAVTRGADVKPASTPTGPTSGLRQIPTTPGPSPLPAPATPGSVVRDNHAMTFDIMKLLERQPISTAVRHVIKGRLEIYAQQTKGVITARDMARAVIKSKDERIKYLEARVNELEKAAKDSTSNLEARLAALEESNKRG
ncbi:hypothetical protein OQA88_4076 [Cercophora sp. LCS_1]